MSLHRLCVLALLVAGTLACSRVPDRAALAELDDQQVENLCSEFVGNYPVQTYECTFADIDFEVEYGYDFTVAECIDTWAAPPASCDLLVGDLRGCYDALYGGDDPCFLDPDALPNACDPVFECDPPDEPEDTEAG